MDLMACLKFWLKFIEGIVGGTCSQKINFTKIYNTFNI